MKKSLRAAALGTAGAVLLAGSLVGVQKWLNPDFAPTATDRELNVNQVVFPGEERSTGANNAENKNSELWEKDDSSDNQNRPKNNDNADYLFRNGQAPDGSSNTPQQIQVNNGSSGGNTGTDDAAGQPGSAAGDESYDIVSGDDAGNADIIIDTGTNGGNGSNGGSGDTDNNNGGSGDAGNGDNGDTPAPTPAPTPTPVNPDPSLDTIQDPEIRNDPSESFGTTIPNRPYDEDRFDSDSLTEDDLTVSLPFSSTADLLYARQKVSAEDLYNALIFFVTDSSHVANYWGAEQYGKLIRITGVSFDGGKTYIADFPATIPAGLEAGQMKIRYEYRYSEKDNWKYTGEANYTPRDARLYIMGHRLTGDQTVIDRSDVLNDGTFNTTLYPDEGTLFILYNYQIKLDNYDSSTGQVSKLFPGWTEGGQLLPFMYTVGTGRHILQPADYVDYDTDTYQVELELYWMRPNYSILSSTELDSSAGMAYLQTLTHYKGKTEYDWNTGNETIETLTVPEYVQAVDFLYYPALSVQYLEIPASTVYVNTEGVTENWDFANRGLQVEAGYTVTGDNPRYTSENGLLYNKEKTEILGVPTGLKVLDVPDTVTKVVLPGNTQLKKLWLHEDIFGELPQVNLEKLSRNAQIFVPDELVNDFITANAATLRKTGACVSPAGDPATRYYVKENYVVDNDPAAGGQYVLYRIMEDLAAWVTLPDYITCLKAGSMASAPYMSDIILNESVTPAFEAGWLDDVASLNIHCNTWEQYEAVLAAVQAEGRSEENGIYVMLLNRYEVDGCVYTTESDGTVLLLQAPQDIIEFDGTVPNYETDGEPLAVTVVGEGAFADCDELEWVELTDSIQVIGKNAFAGCRQLQGVLIGAADQITIQTGAFDSCPALRFIGSNATLGLIEDQDFAITDSATKDIFLFCPTDNMGYTANWTSFTVESNVTSYSLQDCGGTKVLYGNTGEDNPWLALRAGGNIKGDVTLPYSTVEIFSSTFKDSHSDSETGFHVNLDDLWWCGYIDVYAFTGSDIGPDVTLGDSMSYFGDSVFANCQKLQSISLPSSNLSLGEVMFANCGNLQSVSFGGFAYGNGLYSAEFGGCDALTDISFDSWVAPNLIVYGTNGEFYFNSPVWDDGQPEEDHIHITVPNGMEYNYLQEWHYLYAGYRSGYVGWDYGTAFQVMWNDVQNEMADSDPQISVQDTWDEINRRLLPGEKKLRKMLGMDDIDSPDQVYHPYRWTADAVTGSLTLNAALNVQSADLDAATLEMPIGWVLDSIDAGAFAQSPNLGSMSWNEPLAALSDGIFTGVETEDLFGNRTVYLYNNSGAIPALTGFAEGTTFNFGIPDENLALYDNAYAIESGAIESELLDKFWNDEISFDEYFEQLAAATGEIKAKYLAPYVQAWALPMAGYTSLEAMQADVEPQIKAQLTEENGEEPDENTLAWAVYHEMCSRMLTAENRVRAILSFAEEISTEDELTFTVPRPTTGEDPFAEQETEETEETEAPDTVATPETAAATPETAQAADEPAADSEGEPDTGAEDTAEPAEENTAEPALTPEQPAVPAAADEPEADAAPEAEPVTEPETETLPETRAELPKETPDPQPETDPDAEPTDPDAATQEE